ncbi:hypothetical protein KI387_023755 [Taxus chinensis]|uniref:DUF659 domain-containing protein n=1 Tax=Taxus chinensis TaxID=29808 RepID=A0AA38G5N6_TAXCH|nr:hypothetical protein KI387_023755 [Taxus chinensis]
MEEMKVTWVSHGCNIIMDGWTDIRHCPLINIIVSCKDGPYFLRAIDCSGKQKDVEFQFQILKDVIEEVGPSNVVQVITNATYVMFELQEPLQVMIMTQDWTRWRESKTGQGKRVKEVVVRETFWVDVKYITSIITPFFSIIKYGDSNNPNLGEIYECIDNMLGQMKATIRVRDPTLEFYHEHIQPIIQHRWEKLNTPLHMVAYALNPKWYVERPGRVIPLDDNEVSSSSTSERNWSTYGWIHYVKRNRLTSERAEKLVVVHSALCLMDRKTTEYKQTPTLRWDVDPEELRQVEEDNTMQQGLIGLSFEDKDDSSSEEFMDVVSNKQVNEMCRKRPQRVAFYSVDCRGSCGEIFVDLQNHTYNQKKLEDFPLQVRFPSLEEATSVCWSSLPRNTAKLYFAMRIVETFEQVEGREPGDLSSTDLPSVLNMRKKLCEEQGLAESRISDLLLQRIVDVGKRELPPVCAIVGGILGQEVIKAMSCKGDPLKNFFFFDVMDGKGIIEDISIGDKN